MKLYVLFTILLFCPAAQILCQEYNYVHFDTKDGLAGTTVYSVAQDAKGYLWFGTDNGISRFDGKTFTNFTTNEGLTDNEVLCIYADKKGRVWIMPFNKTLCYYYNGKIYNYTNDPALRGLNVATYITQIGEMQDGGVYFYGGDKIFSYTPEGEIRIIADFISLGKKYNLNPFSFLPVNGKFPPEFDLLLYNDNKVFRKAGNDFVLYKTLPENPVNRPYIFIPRSDYSLVYPVSPPFSGYNSLGYLGIPSAISVNTNNGTYLIDSSGNILPTVYLPGKKTSSSIRDTEGNIWFTTLGDGIYLLNSGAMKTFQKNLEAISLESRGNYLYCGLSDGQLLTLKDRKIVNEYTPLKPKVRANSGRLFTIKSNEQGSLFLGYDSHFEIKATNKIILSAIRPVKSIAVIDTDNILVSTNTYTFRYNIPAQKITDTVFRERATKVLYKDGVTYFGTLNGLVIIDSNGQKRNMKNTTPLLSGRVVDMQLATDSSLWLATNDNGVIHFSNGSIAAVINIKKGLSSNGCKSLFLQEPYLWAGTNKGINKIDTRTGTIVSKYTVSDGLPSDNINAVYVKDSIVWVATPGGLSFFDEKNISDSSICDLDFYSTKVSGIETDTSNIRLDYRHNNITFSYTVISFKSAGSITYHYKLTGLDGDWKETSLNTLSYPALPPGNYTFQLYAVNKFGKKSKTVTISFSIAAPFWKTFSFWLTISLALIGVTAWLITRRFRILQQRTKEKNDLNRKVSELEQASMRAQMNPHFIFNCLNSIQHFIIKNDIEKTNQYITQFASLIRQTLDNAARTNIPIADEIRYLTSYMELERMRFPDAFSYAFTIDADLQTDYVYVPSMILQPFVENAIRHGIRNMESGQGVIKISILQNNEGVLFSVEDNGVGREAAGRLKSEQHIEYQSKGISLATNRLELLSAGSDEKITTAITDIRDVEGKAAGTKVDVFFPHRILQKLN